METRTLIGVDFGGTKILTGAMTEMGEILGEPVRVATDKEEEPKEVVRRIAGSVEEVLQRIGKTTAEIGGIGLGVTGPIDIRNGTILECPHGFDASPCQPWATCVYRIPGTHIQTAP